MATAKRIILFLWLAIFGVVDVHAVVLLSAENRTRNFFNIWYDAVGHANFDYDGPEKSSSAYDVAPSHAQNDNERRIEAQRTSFALFGRLLAARAGAELVVRNPISQHAAIRFAERGISEGMIQSAISKGQKFYDVKNGTFSYVLEGGFASGKTLQVGVSTVDGTVATAIRSTRFNPAVKLPDGSARFIPIE